MERARTKRGWLLTALAVIAVVVLGASLGAYAWSRWWVPATERAAHAPCPPFTGGPALPAPPIEPLARLVPVVGSGASLTSLVHHPSGTNFLADRFGRVWSYPEGLDDPPVLDLTGRIEAVHDQGLLGVAVSADASHLYAHFSDLDGDTNLVAWPLVDGRPQLDGERSILVVEQYDPPHHKGGSVLFGPDGMLYLALGDGGTTGDRHDDAQRLDSLLGKVLRIDPTPEAEQPYRVPADNPFVGQDGARPEIFAYGLRNPFRVAFDEAGALWIGDVGNTCSEEVSVLPAGSAHRNLGWNRREGNRPFIGEEPPDHLPPVVTYPHGGEWCAVVGGRVYRGEALSGLQGWYVFGDLCSGRLLALSPERDELRDLGVDARQLVAIVERPDRKLDVLSLLSGVSAVVPADGAADDDPGGMPLAAPVTEEDAATGAGARGVPVSEERPDGAALFGTHCAVCHGTDGSGGVGPELRDGRTRERYPDPADQVDVVADGRGAMPSFASRLSPAELEAVVRYVRDEL